MCSAAISETVRWHKNKGRESENRFPVLCCCLLCECQIKSEIADRVVVADALYDLA